MTEKLAFDRVRIKSTHTVHKHLSELVAERLARKEKDAGFEPTDLVTYVATRSNKEHGFGVVPHTHAANPSGGALKCMEQMRSLLHHDGKERRHVFQRGAISDGDPLGLINSYVVASVDRPDGAGGQKREHLVLLANAFQPAAAPGAGGGLYTAWDPGADGAARAHYTVPASRIVRHPRYRYKKLQRQYVRGQQVQPRD